MTLPILTISFAGTGVSGYNGDGIAATETQITKGGIVVGSDGVIYLADRNNYRIRKISSDGIITTIAGTGTDGFDGDGGLATKAKISRPGSVAIAPDGSIYFTDIDNHRIRRIGMDGIINTIAGVEQTGGFYEIYCGPANQAKLAWPYDMVIEKDGNLYFNDLGFGSGSGNTGSFSIRRISPEGIVTRIAGSSEYLVGYGGDGGPATEAFLYGSQGISVAEDGTIYTADNENYVVRMIKTDGIISTVAGNKYGDAYYEGGAVKSSRIIPRRTAIGPDGCLYIAEGYGWNSDDFHGNKVWKVTLPIPDFMEDEILLLSEDGTETYQFDANGRHLKRECKINCAFSLSNKKV